MTNLEALRPDVRRALALGELRRRGVRVQRDDGGQCKALRSGVATLPGYADFEAAVTALANRHSGDALTDADRAMLDGLPVCEIPNLDMVQAFAAIFKEF